MSRLINLVGKKFDRLTVIKRTGSAPNKDTIWLCHCSCGTYKNVCGSKLRGVRTRSCGCLRKDKPNYKTHGMSRTSTYECWCNMKRRCYDQSNKSYKNYGARGIYVCKRWKDSFENFYSDMGEKPHGMTLNRENNDGIYSPNNCNWATHSEQNKNRRPFKIHL